MESGAAAASAVAAERRRPPLRPRRRGLDSRASPFAGVSAAGSAPSGAASAVAEAPSTAVRRDLAARRLRAALGGLLALHARDVGTVRPHERRARRVAARVLDPDEPLLADVRAAAGDRDDVAVDLGDRVVHVVHVRLDDRDQHLLAGVERHRALVHLVERALEDHREVVERQAVGALEVEDLAGRLLELVQHARAQAGELDAHGGVHLDRGTPRSCAARGRRARAAGGRTRSRPSPRSARRRRRRRSGRCGR